MRTDVVDLRDFYRTPAGQMARRMIRRRLREFWPDLSGQRVLGLGFATPFLRPHLGEAERVIAMMPAAQGVLPWPSDGANATCLVEEFDLPLPDVSVDRVLLVHALEQTEQLRPLLREIWRVLAGGGRLLVVAPNRRGVWARFERTPFGHGQPYTAAQLSRVLRDNQFVPVATRAALFMPPMVSRLMLRWSGPFERLGARWFPGFAGVVMVEASKQLYAATPVRVEARRRPVLAPAQPALPGRALSSSRPALS
jgi:SAM-dependent methyltransferase